MPSTSKPQHSYPFGLMMPVRSWSDGYRFGFNGQEQDDEVYGEGILNTALYWEYDTRLGRRWNLDPVFEPNRSPYLVFDNNPNFYNDIYGDFRTWFGAKLYAITHGGGDVREFGKDDERAGEWYVGKDVGNYKSENSKRLNETEIQLAPLTVGYSRVSNWGGQSSSKQGGGILFGISNADLLANIIRYSPVLPNGAPNLLAGAEAIYFDAGFTTAAEADAGFIFVLVGPDKGQLFPFKEIAGGAVTELGIGAEVGRIDYFGKAENFRKRNAMGARTKVWAGPTTGVGGGISMGVAISDKTDATPRTIAIGLQVNLSISTPGLSGGINRGYILNTTDSYPNKY